MAIKATTKDITNKAEYPKLMISKLTGTIILFRGKYCGTVIKNGQDYDDDIGFYSSEWDMCNFEDFSGTVELTNDYSI